MKKPKMLVTMMDESICASRKRWKTSDGYGDGCLEILALAMIDSIQAALPTENHLNRGIDTERL